MAKDYSRLVENLEEWSRAGEGGRVCKLLNSLNTSKVPRSHRAGLANLARRNGLPVVAIRLLNPIVRSEKTLESEATNQELSEYAVSLLNIGAVGEAEELLNKVDSKQELNALLYRSFVHFSRWEYHLTLSDLEHYCGNIDDPYLAQVGEVNWVAALVFEGQFRAADHLLEQLRKRLSATENWRLLGNALELSAQVAMGQKKWSQASQHLEQAHLLLGEGEGINDFFVRKWKSLINLHQKPKSKTVKNQVTSLKQEARRLWHWESVRDFDFYLATLGGDRDLFLRVYFGTPHPTYREHILKKVGSRWQVPETYLLMPEGGTAEINWDLREGCLVNEEDSSLKPGQLLQRTLQVLCEDLYHPKRLAGLFAELFPNEYFDPNTSPDRVYQVVRRLRSWLKKSSLGLELESRQGGYHLFLKGSAGIILRRDGHSESVEETLHRRLKNLFPQKFTSGEASQALGLSRSSFQRWLDWANDLNIVHKKSAGPHTHYTWA